MRTARSLLALLAAALAATGCGYAALAFRAEIDGLSAEHDLARGQLLRAHDHALRAVSRSAADARQIERLAEIEGAMHRPTKARKRWHAALKDRPGWPYAWAQLAAGEFRPLGDARLRAAALERSAALGDEERGLWRFYALLALQVDPQTLPEPQRTFLESNVRREFSLHGPHLMGRALLSRRETVLCGIVGGEPEPYWCGAARYARPICDQRGLTQAQHRWCENLYALWQQFDYPAS